jgi:hypothetical protein
VLVASVMTRVWLVMIWKRLSCEGMGMGMGMGIFRPCLRYGPSGSCSGEVAVV